MAEIDGGVKNGSISAPIKDREARALPYLQACIKEGLRLYPPTTALLKKEVPPEGDVVNGVHIPGGTDIGYNSSIPTFHGCPG